VRVLALGAFLFLLAVGVRRDQYFVPLLISFVAAAAYLISPLFGISTGKGSTDQS
jgi:CDP-diacylglycerol--serine O-phosphatidyltransferase